MYHREYPITPSQQAVNGSLCIYVEGGKKAHVRQMLFGLTVLRHASDAQLQLAMLHVQRTQTISRAAIEAMLASDV